MTTSAIRPMTAAEVAQMIGIHLNTLKKIPALELPYYRIGRRGDRRYRFGDVEAYIRRRSER
jgi:hypothetical protein